MTTLNVNDFTIEKQCMYDGEHYSVRDNGAVLRHQPENKHARRSDNQWTFGKESSSHPYLCIASVRVHRIVAVAFHGEPPAVTYVVDHIDSNCKNNRPENLRWLTRLENALINPVTRKKIEFLCGSIEAFLENPSMLNDLRGEPNFKWMRAVTPEEAKNCMIRMKLWASSEKKTAKLTDMNPHKNSFSKRVYKPLQKWEVGFGREPGLDLSLTPWCAEYMWGGNPYFPCCPTSFGFDPIDDYFQKLEVGAVLAYEDENDVCPKFKVIKSKILKKRSAILVMCERSDDKWSNVGIELHEKSRHFIHFIIGSYSGKDEAEKSFSEKDEETDFWSEGYGCAYE